MVYHDADTIRTTSHRTITKTISGINGKEEDVEIDWESEFSDLTWDYLPTLNGEKLEKFYSNCQLVKSIFKKSSENTMGFFGAEELYDITSDKNFSEAIRDMKDAMVIFCGEGTMDSMWSGLTDYNIERTYLMAKNIVSANKVQNEYAYYDIGTNILTHTPGIDGDEYMLIDFQKVKLVKPLKYYHDVYKKRVFSDEDTDDDGIYDVIEMGDDDGMKEKVDITGFVRKMVENELYGNDKEAINNNQQIINKVVANIKYNIYENRTEFREQNLDNNKVDINDIYEHQLTVDENTLNNLEKMSNAEKREDYLNFAPSKLEVELWRYKSNPVLKDTDFDGLEDGFGYEIKNGIDVPVALNIPYDKRPKDNYFTGRMHTTRMTGNDAIEVDMNMDYRYFFLSNKMYYDELSTMSLLYANSIYRRGEDEFGNLLSHHSGLQLRSANNLISAEDKTKKIYNKEEIENMDLDKFNNMQVKEMMEHFGFKDVRTYYMGEEGDEAADGADVCRGYKDTHKGKVALGYKNIEYHGLYKTVIGIVIRGTAEDDDWDSDFDMGDLDLRDELNYAGGRNNYDDNYDKIYSKLLNGILNYDKKYATELLHFAGGYPDWKWDYHHAGFDIVSNRILEVLNEYIATYKSNFENDICFWVTGHSMGGGVANLVAASLVYGECGGNADNVYCYTFAAPNTYYLTDKDGEVDYPNATKYRCIFNVVNGDDFVPELPMKGCGWTKYGRVAEVSFRNDFNNNLNKLDIGFYLDTARSEFSITNVNLYRFGSYNYKGDNKIIVEIVDSFINIFQDKTNMREEAYKYVDGYVVYGSKNDVIEKWLPFFGKVYQTYEVFGDGVKKQHQMPAYFMQLVANAMHTKVVYYQKDDNDRIIIDDNGNKAIAIREQNKNEKILLGFKEITENERALYENVMPNTRLFGAKWNVLLKNPELQCPHYLESYYVLAKIIDSVNFR